MEDLSGAPAAAWLGVVGIVLAIFYVYLTWSYRTFENLGIRGPKPWPLFGNMLQMLRKSYAYIDIECVKNYGKVYGIYEGRTPVLVVADPGVAKEILIKEFHCFINRSPFMILQEKPMNRILHVLRDDHWRHVRASLSPVYSSGKLKQMLPTITDCTNHLIAHIDKNVGSPVDVKDVLACYTLDIIAGTAFGLDVRSLEEPNSKFMKCSKELFSRTGRASFGKMLTVFAHILSPKLGFVLQKLGITIFDRSSIDYLEDIVRNLFRNASDVEDCRNFVHLCLDRLAHIEELNSSDVKKTAEGVCWTPKGLTVDEIVANSFVFFLAGYDTVSTFLTCFCYLMATNPDAQQKAYEEIMKIGKRNLEVGYDDLKNYHYVDMCMDETLRLYPPLLRLDRICNTSTVVGGIRIPKGLKVNIAAYALQHDADYWDDPYSFKPERFCVDAQSCIPPCAYIPFGAGPRNCIGMRFALLESKVAIIKLLSEYLISTCTSTPESPLVLGKSFRLLSSAKPIFVSFQKRQLRL